MQVSDSNLITQSPVHQAPAKPRPGAGIHWPSAWQFALTMIAILGLWSTALGLALYGLVDLFSTASYKDVLPTFLMTATMAFSGLLLLPSAGYALSRLMGRPIPPPKVNLRFLRPTVLILLLPLVLLVGYWVSSQETLAWLFLPPLHILAIGLPVLWLLYLGLRGLPLGSPQRAWGIFGSGLVLGPALILIAELFALFVFVMVGVIWIANQPELVSRISLLFQQFELSTPSPEEMNRILGPYLVQPGFIFAALVFGSVIVPLIEEALKPIGVWLLVGHHLTPLSGFTAGLISGAGYALFESLALTTSGGDWAFLVMARIGTAAVHITTAGLMGWALASAWEERRYARLALTYLVAISIHGLWNGLTLLFAFTSLSAAQASPAFPLFISRLGSVAPFGLGVLSILMLILLLRSNSAERKMFAREASPDQFG